MPLLLSILKDTPLEKYYCENKFHVLSKDEYVDIVCEQLEYLNPKIVIQRLTGDPMKEDLIEPKWVVKKVDVLNSIDKKIPIHLSYKDKISETIEL